MLAYLDEAFKYFTSIPEEEDYETYQAIRALIREHRPEVDEEWLRQKAGELSGHRFSNQHPEVAHDWLCRTFREAGMTVIK